MDAAICSNLLCKGWSRIVSVGARAFDIASVRFNIIGMTRARCAVRFQKLLVEGDVLDTIAILRGFEERSKLHQRRCYYEMLASLRRAKAFLKRSFRPSITSKGH